MTTYISAADTAKLVRKALAPAFPNIKFSVTSKTYSGGASIRVRWIDGPTEAQVNEVAGKFAGATFDGMQDLKSYHSSTDEQGNEVHYGADFVFCEREYSGAFTRVVCDYISTKYRVEIPQLDEWNWPVNAHQKLYGEDHWSRQSIGDELHQVRHATAESELDFLKSEIVRINTPVTVEEVEQPVEPTTAEIIVSPYAELDAEFTKLVLRAAALRSDSDEVRALMGLITTHFQWDIFPVHRLAHDILEDVNLHDEAAALAEFDREYADYYEDDDTIDDSQQAEVSWWAS